MNRQAIFLHSSWRTGSTYVWAKFREQPGTCCYFEPLNEHLATASAAMIDGFRPWSFANHPPLDAPYLEEFRPLVEPGGGVRGFPAPLAFGNYCAGADAPLPELEDYLNDLSANAARLGRRPVYGFVRTDLRVGWFRARTPGAHIFIRREPRRQFLSMLRQAARDNVYFLERAAFILDRNKDEPAFAPLRAALQSARSSRLREFLEGGSAQERGMARLYLAFYFMRLLARPLGEAHCDLVIDIDRLSLNEAYRREIESRLAGLVGMAISFADCRIERYDANLAWSDPFFDALEREIEALAGAGPHEAAA
jgi:hypothetical protein